MQNLFFWFTTKELRLDLESLQFLAFSAKHCVCEMGKTNGHGKSRNGRGKSWENMSVGTLSSTHYLCDAYLGTPYPSY